jgi:uncharacterized membrane protein
MENILFVIKKIFRWFLSGLVVLLPLGATLILIGWAFNFLDQLIGGQSIFAQVWRTLFGWLTVSPRLAVILGYLFMFAVIVAVGHFAQGFARQRLGATLRGFFDRIPIVNKIYRSVEQLIDLWSKKQNGEEASKIGEVVMVNFMNVKTFGVLSSRNTYEMNGEKHFLVYIPSAPIPATGFTYFFKTSDVFECETKMDDMTKVVVSLGVLGQEVMGDKVALKRL